MEKFAAWNNDDVDGGCGLVMAEYLASQALGAIANDCAADFPRRRNSQPRM
jgi:hypothetical protein